MQIGAKLAQITIKLAQIWQLKDLTKGAGE